MPAPVLYVTDLTFDRFDPADLFDLTFLLRSPEHDLRGVCVPEGGDGERTLSALSVRVGKAVVVGEGQDGLRDALSSTEDPVNLVVVGNYPAVAVLLQQDRALFREKVARLFLVGGHANDYSQGISGERLPIDPRLKERNPERFSPDGDARIAGNPTAFTDLLTCGEAVIWLPRDICLWRYAAPGILAGRGEMTEFLLRELFWSNLAHLPDRYDAADAPVLLSALPALLLATRPDPFLWMRLFRAVTARVEIEEAGPIASIETQTDRPNLYIVLAIDSAALGKRLTETLLR